MDDHEIGPVRYLTIRDHLAADVRRGEVVSTPTAMIKHVLARGGVTHLEAVEVVERFRADVVRHLGHRPTTRSDARP